MRKGEWEEEGRVGKRRSGRERGKVSGRKGGRREGRECNVVREISTLTVSRAIFACVSYTSTVKSLLIA